MWQLCVVISKLSYFTKRIPPCVTDHYTSFTTPVSLLRYISNNSPVIGISHAISPSVLSSETWHKWHYCAIHLFHCNLDVAHCYEPLRVAFLSDFISRSNGSGCSVWQIFEHWACAVRNVTYARYIPIPRAVVRSCWSQILIIPISISELQTDTCHTNHSLFAAPVKLLGVS